MRELRGDWRDIFQGFSVAFDIKKMFAGFVGLALTIVIAIGIPYATVYLINPALISVGSSQGCNCKEFIDSLRLALYKTLGFWKYPYMAAIGLMLIAVWSYFGAIITRIAAINLTKDDSLGFAKASDFASKKYLGFFSPWVVCLLGLLFFALCNAAGGFIGRIPYIGEILVALGLPLAILSGFIMFFIMIGYHFASIMFWPTIGVEGTDTFDAISRSFQYLYARPWHYIWYILMAKAYGILTILFVWLFGAMMIVLGLLTASVGMGAKMSNILALLPFTHLTNMMSKCCPLFNLSGNGDALPITAPIAAVIIGVWLIMILGLMAGYAISYSLSANTIIYLLLRKKVDEIEMKEVWEEEAEEPGIAPASAPAAPAQPETGGNNAPKA